MGQQVGVGSELAMGAAAMNDAIRQSVMDRLRQAEFEESKRRNLADESLRGRQIESAAELKRQAELDRQQRDRELGESRRETNFYRGLALTPEGATIPASDAPEFAHFGVNRFLQDAPLEEPAPPESLAAPAPMLRGRVVIPGTIANSPAPSQRSYQFTGTAGNQLAQDRIDVQREIASAHDETARARQDAIDAYRQANLGLRERDVNRRESQYNDRLNPPDDPTLPRGVQNYLLQLRSRHGGDLQNAESELLTAWPDLLRDHPTLEATKAVNALRGMFAAPYGASKTDQLLNDIIGQAGNANTPTAPASGGRGAAPSAATPMLRGTVRVMSPNGPGPGAVSANAIRPGVIVTLRTGQRVRVTQTYPDGTFDHEPVR